MALLFVLAAAAAATQPVPTGIADPDIKGMVTQSEYPADALARGKSAAAAIEIRVDTEGRPQGCSVVRAIGDASLAKDICKITLKKRYNPARLRDGTPAFAVVTTMVRLYVPGTPDAQAVAAARLEPANVVKVASLRGGASSEDVGLVIAVDPSARVVQCGPKAEEQRTIAEAICEKPDLFHPSVVTDAKGAAMPYIAETTVRVFAAADTPSRP
ncbi:energy transducer TonB [Novosphingobium sp. KCTC 2891]|uniref:energy transducer TonB n=1 Tax=Novosphingobium sp. KCTC 2891 TaxID=2989730 RepID=UPI0022234AC4|nr:energy transducer TonB [Novosphingobium sp. KCTC 2891]MCW1382378.1 energy transducer TonB [Novosphingobium sp. KCTC 2891]